MPNEPSLPNTSEGPLAADRFRHAFGLPRPPGPTGGDALRRGLLDWLRRRLDAPELGYLAPPSPLAGGTDMGGGTWRFRLFGAPPGFRAALALRVHAFAGGAYRAARESGMLAALARAGYPAPAPLLTCTDRTVLGGAFLVTRYVEGGPLARAPAEAVPEILREAQLALHRIDPAPVIAVLREKGVAAAPVPPADDLALLAREARGLAWVTPLLDWMAGRLPPAPERPCRVPRRLPSAQRDRPRRPTGGCAGLGGFHTGRPRPGRGLDPDPGDSRAAHGYAAPDARAVAAVSRRFTAAGRHWTTARWTTTGRAAA